MPFVLTKRILEAYADYQFVSVIVWGPPRYGKSSFTLQVLAEVYGLLDFERWRESLELPDAQWLEWYAGMLKQDVVKLRWDSWKKWMVFLPTDFFARIDEAQKAKRQFPLLAWDDAGLWASAYRWTEDFSKSLSDYLNVGGSDYAALLFTTPHPKWLLRHIRDIPGSYTCKIIKITGNPENRFVRMAKFYTTEILPDMKKEFISHVWDERFSVRLPQMVFYEYNDVRRQYAELAKQRAIDIVHTVMKQYGAKAGREVAEEIRRDFNIDVEEVIAKWLGDKAVER